MSDFLMCQILLNISNTVNIKLNIPNPSKSIQFIVLKHFIIFVCIPFPLGIAESLTWQSTENRHPSLGESIQSEGFKDSRNWNPECSFLQGPISVTFQSDDIFDAHEFFLKNGHAFFIPYSLS